MTKKFLTVLLLSAFLASCAHWEAGEVHPAREPVLFDGLEFKVNSRELRYSPLSLPERAIAPEKLFFIVELSLRNSYASPVPPQFQPRFTLVDSSGAEHQPHKELSSPLKGVNGTDLAPRATYTKRLVFDVPEGEYRLRVFTPVVVKTGPEGGLQGRFFYYDLGALK